jgi:leader peptidase (prepilin peptidase) / N-methyltransferase
MAHLVTTIVAALVAAALAAAVPRGLSRLPEPQDAEDSKVSYRELAAAPRLSYWFAAGAGAYAAVAAWLLGDAQLLPVWIVLAVVAPVLGYVDWRTHRLPYLIVAPTWVAAWLATALSALWIGDWHLLAYAAIGNVVLFLSFWSLSRIGELFIGDALGYGDVRLSAVLGVALGPLGIQSTLWAVMAGFMLGAVAGVVITRGHLRTAIAFGPYMLLGALAGLLV